MVLAKSQFDMGECMKRFVFRSIFSRYVISYAAVMFVLYIGVGIYVSNSYSTAIRASITEENTNRLSALRMQHEEKLSAMISIAGQLGLSPYIAPFKLEENPMKAYFLKQQLASYYSEDNSFEQLYVIFHTDDYLYSSNTSVSLDIFTNKLVNYDALSPDDLQSLLRKNDDIISFLPAMNVQSIMFSNPNRKMITFIIPLRLDGRFNIGNVLFLIPEDMYQRLFADEINQPRNMYIYHGDEIISAARPIDIPDEVILQAMKEQQGGFPSELTSEEGNHYLLFVQKGDIFGLNYVSLIPRETVQMRAARSKLGFALFMLLLSIPCSLLTVFFARRHVKPIKELQKSIGVTAPAADDGFSAIRSGIESLIGQNKELHTLLDENKPAFKAAFIKNFIKCRFSTREEAIQMAADLGLDIDRTYYLVSLMTGVLQDNQGLEKFISLAPQYDADGYGMEIVEQEQYLFVMFSDRRESLVSWTEAAKNLLGSLDREAVISASNVHVDFLEATSAYLEASTAYDNRFVMGSEYVLWFSDVSATAKDMEPFTRGYLEGFRKALHAGDSRALNDRINELFQILRDKKFSLFAFRMIYNDIISMLLNKYLSYDGATTDTLQYYDIFELSRIRQVEDLVETLRQLCAEILRKEEQTAVEKPTVIRQVIDYIRQNYTDPALSMGAVADKYGISASRLSLEYKELTGMYPSEYLLLLRMEKAKELLAQTDMPIQDVACAVGYYDSSGFIRRFKKHMAITPAQYRQSVRNSAASSHNGSSSSGSKGE